MTSDSPGAHTHHAGRWLMPPTLPPRRDSDPVAPTTPIPEVDTTLHLSTRTLDWLADHPQARRFVNSVWDTLTELERSGHYSGAINALRRMLTRHQPTATGRCRTCRRLTWRRQPFPCLVWHQIHCDLLGLFADTSRRQPSGPDSSLGPNGSGSAPTTSTIVTGG
jgi:hypothetical protein